jgi:hypothetical protein
MPCHDTNRTRQRWDLLSPEQVYWEPLLITLSLFIPLAPLVHDDVNDFILLTDILSGYRHELVDDLVEQFGVAVCVVPYARHELPHGLFVLLQM